MKDCFGSIRRRELEKFIERWFVLWEGRKREGPSNGVDEVQESFMEGGIVKAEFDGDIRRFSLVCLEYEELQRVLLEAYNPPFTAFVIKYRDDEGDLVSIEGEGELEEALFVLKNAGENVLKLVLSPSELSGKNDTDVLDLEV